MPRKNFAATHDGILDTLTFGFPAKQLVYKNDGNADHTVVVDGETYTVKADEALRMPLDGQYSATSNGASGDYRCFVADYARPALELSMPAKTYAAIEADSVTGASIANDAIDSEHYAAGSIDAEHIASDILTADKVADVADDNATAGIVCVHVIDVAGGPDANEDITVSDKFEVLGVFARLDGAGTPGSTLTVKNGANAISDAIDCSSAGDTDLVYAGEIDNANSVIAANGTLRATIASTSSDFPAAKVFVEGIKRA